MRIYKTDNYYKMSCKAADIIAAQMIMKPDSTLGLATGSTPEGIYNQLIGRYNKGEIDFSEINTVNLDEYIGLNENDQQSYHYYMDSKLFRHVNIPEGNCYLPNGLETDSEKECKRYEQSIKDLGFVDLQLLGLGLNGHIGFNEPDQHFSKGVHLVKLAKTTVDSNSRFFDNPNDVPRYAYTMGIQNIMQAKKIILVVNGKAKAEILKQVIKGRITPQVPASILQLHNNVTVVADKEALSLL